MRLTLDWDTESEREQHYPEVKERPRLEQIEAWQLRQSASREGYHYLEREAATTWDAVVRLREEWGDDGKRLRLDKKRHGIGSPFLQVLYSTKYMERWGWNPSSGLDAAVIEGSKPVRESERIKDESGRLNYRKILTTLLDEEGFTQAQIADKTHLKTYAKEDGGISRSTVSDYARGQRAVTAESLKRWLRRAARSRGLGHYSDDRSLDRDPNSMVEYVDDDLPERRTIVEYVDVPMDDPLSVIEYLTSDNPDPESREYGLLNIHTGSYNENHTDRQLKMIHDKVVEHVLEVLSPALTNPQTGGEYKLDLDRTVKQSRRFRGDVESLSREPDSLNYEHELMDVNEMKYYLANLVSKTRSANKGVDVDSARKNPLVEILLWDDGMRSLEWHVLGAWTGDSLREMTVLRDSNGWW